MKLESVVHMLTLNFRILENIQETTPVIENPMNIPNVPPTEPITFISS